MNIIQKLLAVTPLLLCLVFPTFAQDRQVRIERIEANGKPMKSDYKVSLVVDSKEISLVTNKNGFVVPEKLLAENADKYVGVIISFNKFRLEFSEVHVSNFDVTWQEVGVRTKSFGNRPIEGLDPSKIKIIYHIQFAGEPERILSGMVPKSKDRE